MLSSLLCGLLGLGTGIFVALALIEKPIRGLMWNRRGWAVSDSEVRTVHAILKRVIHLLPPTMITTMATASLLIVVQMIRADFATGPVIVACVFFPQLLLIVRRLGRDIRGVDSVPSDGPINGVRDGLGALALLHHRGLLMTVSALIAQLAIAGGLL